MRYLLDTYRLDTERRELRHGAGLVPLEPQVFDILEYLIRNREHVVSKGELLPKSLTAQGVLGSARSRQGGTLVPGMKHQSWSS